MSNKKLNKPNFWRSIKEYHDNDEVFEAKVNEFNDGVTDDFSPADLKGVSRRKFLAALSASAAFAVTSCTDYRDKGEIIPYNDRPEGVLPGKPNYYASTLNCCPQHCGVLIKVREGRPVKIDGNPDHPLNNGKLCTIGQASLLDLYDPDRLQHPLKEKSKIDWTEADDSIINGLQKAVNANKEIAILTGSVYSPTTAKLLNEFQNKYPTAKIYSYELVSDNNRREAWKEIYGSDSLPEIKLEKADVILSLESDFLSREGNYVENMRKFSSRRDVMKGTDFNRLYSAEGTLSLTGMNADYRLRIRPDQQLEFVLSLINEIVNERNASEINLDFPVLSLISKYDLKKFVSENGVNEKYIKFLIDDLIQNKGSVIVYAGDTLDKDVHKAVILLNKILGDDSLYNKSSYSALQFPLADAKEIKELISAMNANRVAAVVHLDANPAYHFSGNLNYAEALSKVELSVALVGNENETSNLCSFTLPINHPFESWNDFQMRSDVYSTQQPVISPLFNSRQKEAVLLNWINESKNYSEDIYHKYLMENFRELVYNNYNTLTEFKTFWYTSLHDGVVEIKSDEISLEFNQAALSGIKVSKTAGTVVHLQKSYFVGDGRFANNGWLQELPHPVTKVAWDNFASISPATAKQNNLQNNDLIKIDVNGKSIELPVMVQPGNADNLISVELGYGRSVCGDVGKDVGFNTNILLDAKSNRLNYILPDASFSKTGKTYSLVSTQEHHALDDFFTKDFHLVRDIIQGGTLDEYKNDPHFLHKDKHSLLNITEMFDYDDVKWAMSIDLNKCTGCTACVTSCNVENNVPVVGKDQVGVGREMQWMRIDRYYSGTPEEPLASQQPMLCQHCDNAPCENVCPVNATNHSTDGLNQMAYNRCVGTRYCSNNCPYKVRRFNFFNFRDHFASAYYENDVTALVNNPEVTVRARGVMEKCTFCIQRIMEEREDAIREGREINGNNVKTACQTACPADAIIFGDVNNKESEIYKYRNHDLGYHVLQELNVRPNVTYIAKLRNTHSEEV